MDVHPSRSDVINRLKRAHGHLAKVIGMLEADEPCLAVAQQLQATVNAIGKAKSVHVQDHIEQCLSAALADPTKNPSKNIEEFKLIAKYL
jgi:DNA-binding FrmR family transcriptional regulator